jgi:hypothetical protein
MNKAFASLIVASAVLAAAAPAHASAFTAGTVVNVAHGDKLFIRKWPASYSQVIDAHRRGEMVSLTGRCKNTLARRQLTSATFRPVSGTDRPCWAAPWRR